MSDCHLGLIEHDGFQYCFVHFGFYHYLDESRSRTCNRAKETHNA